MDWLAGIAAVIILLLIFAEEGSRKKKEKRYKPGELQVRGGKEDWVVMETGTFEIVYRNEDQEKCFQYIKDHTDW